MKRDKILLKLVRVYRGDKWRTIRLDRDRAISHVKHERGWTLIERGPLKGCWNMPRGPVAKFGRGYVLLFKPVIRIGL